MPALDVVALDDLGLALAGIAGPREKVVLSETSALDAVDSMQQQQRTLRSRKLMRTWPTDLLEQFPAASATSRERQRTFRGA